MRRSSKESTNVSIRRRLRFIRCPECVKFQKTQKLSAHMKEVHSMKRTGRESETLMICLQHRPSQYINVRQATASQIKEFVENHATHIKTRRKLKKWMKFSIENSEPEEWSGS